LLTKGVLYVSKLLGLALKEIIVSSLDVFKQNSGWSRS